MTTRQQLVSCGVSCALALSGSVLAADNLWDGSDSNDWNDPDNWSLNRVPVKTGFADNAAVNTLNNFPVITGTISTIPQDIFIGNGAGGNGRVDHTAGTLSSGGGNWMFIGREGGTGVYNLADTAGSGGTLTGFATGAGSLDVGGNGRLYVGGGVTGSGGNGTMNMNTSGTVTSSDLAIGARGATGLMNLDAGTVNTSGWNFIGKEEGAAGGSGTLRISGGTINNVGTRTFIGQGNSAGTMEMSGGTYNNTTVNNDTFFAVGVGNNANATTASLTMTGGTINANRAFSIGGMEAFGGNGGFTGSGKGIVTVNGASALINVTGQMFVAQGAGSTGTLNVQNGTVQMTDWLAVGRAGGTGVLNLSGGTVTKSGAGNLVLGTGTNGSGTINHTGGTLTVSSGATWLGEDALGGVGTGTYNLSGTGVANLGVLRIGQNSTAQGTFNLNGGTANIAAIQSGSTGATRVFNFNGGLLRATAASANYMEGIGRANVRDGGASIDTDGNNITINQTLEHSNIGGDNALDGGLTKSGAGTLSLGGTNTYTGKTTVQTGTLALTSTGSIGASTTIEVQAGAILDVSSVTNWTLGATQSLTGHGTVNASAGAQLAGTVGPGSSPGTLTINGATAMSGTYDYEYTGGGTAADLLDVNGAFSLTGATLSLTDLGAFNIGDKFTLAAYDSLTGMFSNYNADDALWIINGGVWLLDYNDAAPGSNGGGDLQTPGAGYGYITLTAVPEPAAVLIGSLGLLALVRRRRG